MALFAFSKLLIIVETISAVTYTFPIYDMDRELLSHSIAHTGQVSQDEEMFIHISILGVVRNSNTNNTLCLRIISEV